MSPLPLQLFTSPVKPFLKWPGGKRWASEVIAAHVRKHLSPDGTYFEPFLGGGAVFFSLRPSRSVLSDVNKDLINTYEQVRAHHEKIRRLLAGLPVSSESYAKQRVSVPRCRIQQAVRFLYLNRTAFAGMYRTNRDGEFNVPFGGGDRTPAALISTDILERAANGLRASRLASVDFEVTIERARAGDVVYCDPTYTVAHDNNGFVRYNETVFTWADQMRLQEAATRAVSRGATVIVSNAHHSSVRMLYDGWRAITLHRPSLVSPTVSARRSVNEYLFVASPKGLATHSMKTQAKTPKEPRGK